MARSGSGKKLSGYLFVIIAISAICITYYTFAYCLYLPRAYESNGAALILGIFHVLFAMVVWSFVQAMITDPGQVPPYWGFYMGDPEHKRKRYCLMCHVFKPDRCHHCSACNRCVLNMDHHCPWINNCVGFMNRKVFMLLLLYITVTVYFILVFMLPDVVSVCLGFFHEDLDMALYPSMLYVGVFLMLCMLAFLISVFIKFHLNLVVKNSTTIENMEEAQRKGKTPVD
jgi:hypothetical protein